MTSNRRRRLLVVLLCIAVTCLMLGCHGKKENTEQFYYEEKENAEQFYYKTLLLFDVVNPGFGVDTSLDNVPLHYPMAYALYASAEAHRALITKDPQALENAVRSAVWLVDHNDLNTDEQIGWGLPRAWDAGSDGSVNPPHTEYAITTALVIQALLDTWDAIEKCGDQSTQLQTLLLGNAMGAFCTFQDKYDLTPSGLVFWYSTAPQDKFHIINSHAMLVGQFQRLSTYPIPEDTKYQIETLTKVGFDYLRNSKQKDSSEVIFWNSRGDVPEGGVTRPNDSCHEIYTLQGVLDYQLYSQTKVPLVQEADVTRNIQRFLEDSWVREFPRGGEFPPSYQTILDRPARLWGLGYLLYLSARLGLNDLADALYKVLVVQYGQQEILIFRPDLEDMHFYPRHVAHALFGLSYYVW
jgi:hypothetical protein